MERKPVTLTPEELHILFEIRESLDDVQDNISKYNAVTDIFVEALSSMKANGYEPTSSSTYLWIASVLYDYSSMAGSLLSKSYNTYNNLFLEKNRLSLEV